MRIAEMLLCGVLLSLNLPLFSQAGTDHPTTAELALAAKQPLSQSGNGIDGNLELWQDARLTLKFSQQIWGTGGNDIDDDPKLAIFRKDPPHNAELQLVSRDGNVVQREPLERSLVHLKAAHLYGDARTSYQVTIDYSAGFGSYSGPITTFVEVRNGHFTWIEATGIDGKTERMALMESLKTDWKEVPSQSTQAVQFLEAACRPKDFGSGDTKFQITYTRYFFDGKRWTFLARTVNGFTEFDNGFPPRKLFP